MPAGKEANAHSQPAEGSPSLQRRRQVAHYPLDRRVCQWNRYIRSRRRMWRKMNRVRCRLEKLGVLIEEEEEEEEEDEKDASDKRHEEEATTEDICPAAEKEKHHAPLTAAAQEEKALIVAERFVVPSLTELLKEKEDLGTEKEEVKQEEKEKEQEWEKDIDQELSQLKELEQVTNCNISIKALVRKLDVSAVQDININPWVPKLSQAPLTSSQEGSICPSSMGTDVAGEADGDLQSVSPALSGSTRTEPAAPTLAGAAEEEQHRAPHAAVAQEEEEALAPASHGFDEQEAEAEAQRKAFDLPRPTASELAQQEIASRLARDFLRKALAVIQETKEQPLEQEDVAQSHVDATTAPIRPAAVQDIETSVAAEPLAEASMNEQQMLVQAQTEAPAPPWVTEVDTPVQAVDRQQVRRAPKKHQGEASTAVASTPLHEDEQTVSPAAIQDTQDEAGIAALPDTEAVQKRRPSRFRRALKALRRAFRFSCSSPQVEE